MRTGNKVTGGGGGYRCRVLQDVRVSFHGKSFKVKSYQMFIVSCQFVLFIYMAYVHR